MLSPVGRVFVVSALMRCSPDASVSSSTGRPLPILFGIMKNLFRVGNRVPPHAKPCVDGFREIGQKHITLCRCDFLVGNSRPFIIVQQAKARRD